MSEQLKLIQSKRLFEDFTQARVLRRQTLDFYQVEATAYNGERVLRYPVMLESGERTYRIKSLEEKPLAKYLWRERGVDIPRLYSNGGLAAAIKASGGELWLLNGEPAVWAFHSALRLGASSAAPASATFGEGNLNDETIALMGKLGVKRLYVLPDCDDTGLKSAAKLWGLVAGSGIDVVFKRLPFEHGSKADFGDYWPTIQGLEPDEVLASLKGLPDIADSDLAPYMVLERPALSYSSGDEALDEIARQVEEALGVGGAVLAGGYYAKRVACPIGKHEHDKDKPAAMYNPSKKILFCYKCGRKYLLKEVAEALGIEFTIVNPSSSLEAGAARAPERALVDKASQVQAQEEKPESGGDEVKEGARSQKSLEMLLCGGLLKLRANIKLINKIASYLRPEHFEDEAAKDIWRALIREAKRAEVARVSLEVIKAEGYDVEGVELSSDELVTIANRIYVRYLRRYAALELARAHKALADESNDVSELADEVLEIGRSLHALAAPISGDSLVLSQLTNNIRAKNSAPIASFLPALDGALGGGFRRQTVSVFLANSGDGKSGFLINNALDLAQRGYRVVFITSEMSLEETLERFWSLASGVPLSGFEAALKADNDYLARAERRLLSLSEYLSLWGMVNPDRPKDANELRRICQRALMRLGRIDVIVLDWLNISMLQPVSAKGTKFDVLGEFMAALRELAQLYNAVVLTANQTKQELQRAPRMPEAGDGYGASAPLFDADNILGGFNVSKYNGECEPYEYHIKALKARRGRAGSMVKVLYYYPCGAFAPFGLEDVSGWWRKRMQI